VDAFTLVAQDIVLGNVTTTARNIILESIRKRKISDPQGLSNEITFKAGIKYMVIF